MSETVKLSTLIPDGKNANLGTPRGNQMIEDSLRQYGAGRSILLDKHGNIVAGNKTVENAAAIGMDDVIVVQSDGTKLVAVQRTDLDLADPHTRQLAIADNRSGQVSLDWDTDTLKGLVEDGVDLAPFWTADELATLWPVTVDLQTDEDAVPEPPAEAITKPGDVILLGRHRLMCGDCRDFSHVSALMAGSKINVAVTSPPYASQRKYDETSGFKPIPPDEYVAWYRDVAENIKTFLSDDGSYFCNIKEHCEDGQRSLYVKDLTLAHVREWGWRFVDEFVWKKNGVPGSWPNRFRNDFEPVFHFSTGSSIKFKPSCVGCESDHAMLSGERSTSHSTDAKFSRSKKTGQGTILPGNVLSIGCETAGDHSAPFPVALPEFFIKAFSDEGDIIFDPFMGSGTTLIAAEKNGRTAYGTEISPIYCDVIVTRWEQATGKKAVLSAG
jgi:site-specific DNA-methyltransferase (adenine-specific)/site-specific DNA-methyltransferase (cytosine-N4-specific)